MNDQSHIGRTDPPRSGRRSHLWRLLLCSMLWAIVSFGCITANFVTDVIHNPTDYGAIASIELEYDPGVYNALQKLDPTITQDMLPTDPANGWVVKEEIKGRKVTMRRKFDTLAELQTLPKLLAGDSADQSEPFVKTIAVTAQMSDSFTIQYIYTATVVIPARDPATSSDADSGEDFDLNSLLADEKYAELKAALEQAGAGKFVVQAYLPGTIKQQSINGQPSDDISGGRVRWIFSEDTPGTFELHAISEGPTTTLAEVTLSDLLGSNEYIAKFHEIVGKSHPMRAAALSAGNSALAAFRGETVTKGGPTSRIEAIIAQSAYFGAFCEDNGTKKTCLMPSVYRALPLINRLIKQLGDDEEKLSALSNLLGQLVENDLKKLSNKAP